MLTRTTTFRLDEFEIKQAIVKFLLDKGYISMDESNSSQITINTERHYIDEDCKDVTEHAAIVVVEKYGA